MNSFFPFFFISTLIYFPIYYAMRRIFFNLPLHRDTGFYVSNHTVCSKKIDFSKGWNARFAMCSKVLPEFFYSFIYLKHGGIKYPFFSRFYYSLLNYVTAIFVGISAFWISNESALFYAIGLVSYGLMSSHPFVGSYFENGEQFELFFQNLGFVFIFLGMNHANLWFIQLGVSFWLFEGFFIKTISLGAVFLIELVILSQKSEAKYGLLLINAGWLLLYCLWVKLNGQKIIKGISFAIGNEKYS